MVAKDAKGKTSTDTEKDLIRDLATLLTETGLSEIEIEKSGLRVRVARQLTLTGAAPALSAVGPSAGGGLLANPPGVTDAANDPGAITSPMVGTAYLAPEPGAAPFITIGDTVKAGDTIAIIEAMKTMNQIPAPRAGRVTAILYENGQPVEFGEPLVILS